MELIRNGGFEQEPDWAEWTRRGRCEIISDEEVAHSGRRCARLAAMDYIYQTLGERGTRVYSSDGVFNIWAKNVGDDVAYLAVYAIYRSNGPENLSLVRTLYRLAPGSEWQRLEKEISQDHPIQRVYISVEFGNILVDDVSADGYRIRLLFGLFPLVLGRPGGKKRK